jgi:O-antigen/teichoic acid export membrane protein
VIKHKLFKNAFIYTLTEVINKAIPFLLLPIMTSYLSPEDYGRVATYGAFTAIVAVFIHLSMVGAVNVNYFKITNEQLKVYIANTLIIVSVSSMVTFLTILIFDDTLSALVDIPWFWLCVGVIVTSAQFLTMLNLGLWQVEQQSKAFGSYQIAQMITNTSLVLVLVVGFEMGWEGSLIGQTIASILFAFISFGLIYKRGYLSFHVNKADIKDALKFGVPLIPHALSGWFRTGVDRVMLTAFIGTSATGIYSVGYQFGLVVGIIAMAFNQAYSPFLYKKLANIDEQGKKRLVKFTYLYFIGIILLTGILSVIAPYIIQNFLDERYHASSEIVGWVLYGYAFQGMYLMVVNYIFYTKRTYILSAITFLTGLLHVGISYYLIKLNGIIGAAQATTISFFIMFLLVWVLSSRIYSMPWYLVFIKGDKQ